MTKTARVRSRTDPAVVYRVDYANGEAVCTCPGFNRWGHCWHTKAVKEDIMEREDPKELSRQLVPVARTLPTLDEMNVMNQLAKNFESLKGSLFPETLDSPAKVCAVIEAGREIGAPPMIALKHAFIVNGRVQFGGELMEAAVLRGDPTARFIYHTATATRCDVELQRHGRAPVRYGLDMKEVPQVIKKGPWNTYPADMLRWHVVKRVCRMGAADLINGMLASEGVPVEVGQAIAEGDYIDAQATDVTDAPAAAPAATEPAPAEAKETAKKAKRSDQDKAAIEAVLGHAKTLSIKSYAELGQWLGLSDVANDSTGLYDAWFVPAVEQGIAPERAAAIACAALDAVKAELGKNGGAIADAVGTVDPLGQLRREVEQADAPADAEEGAFREPDDAGDASLEATEPTQAELVKG